jgi:hypothetical protein
MPEIQPLGANPLQKYFRQPKVYLDLPSKGKYYPEGVLDMPETGELPIFAMTAKDELTMKTPDALLNGAATVELIKSCVPNIKDPWQMPSIDLDAVLIAIRIATYGENLEITTKIPNVGEEKDFQIDLRKVLNKLTNVEYIDEFEVNDMIIHLKPLTYKEFTDSAMKTFEEQRIFRLVNDDKIPEEEKLARFNESFIKLTSLTVSVMAKSIRGITVDGETVNNPIHIQEFVDNADKLFYNTVIEHLEEQRDKFKVEPFKVISTDEEIAKGAPTDYEVPITFDQSNFFA